ncbi:MAG: hypothetical protein F6J97_23575 [Leptolyngbya sp. SIO4C1]|nr:hypothetical protein [Leptolyngbya sp. SIO4C1]
MVTYSVPKSARQKPQTGWQLCDLAGQSVPLQAQTVRQAEQTFNELTFLANQVPGVGYRGYWLYPADATAGRTPPPPSTAPAAVLENELLRVSIDTRTGDIACLLDKAQSRQVFSGPANQLQAFRDRGQYWDAWNIAPDYESHPLPPAQLESITWLERGPLRQRLAVVRQLGQSKITQHYILDINSPLLKIATWVDWQATQVILKVNFPLTAEAEQATYETPFGTITRSTRSQTACEQAKWEVPALRWADLSAENAGVSLLTDCKHGFDAQPNQLRLTLLKAPLWPDPKADRGQHHFTYAIYPHRGNWQQTPQQASALSLPLTTRTPETQARNQLAAPAARSFLQLSPANLVLAAFKPAEDSADEFILRAYDASGQGGQLVQSNALGLAIAQPVNLLEQPVSSCPNRPYQIHTYRLKT